jgi:WD40 repeat protein
MARIHKSFGLFFLLALLPRFLTPAFADQPASQPTQEPMLTIEAGTHTASLRRMATDAGNRFLVTGSADKTVRVWDLPAGQLLRILRPPVGKGHEGIIEAVDISPDGRTVVCGGRTKVSGSSYQIYFFDRESGELTGRVTALPGPIVYLKYSRDGRHLAAGLGAKAGLRVYATEKNADDKKYLLVKEDSDYKTAIRGVDFDPVGRLVTVSTDGFVHLYDKAFKLVAVAPTQSGKLPFGVRFSPDGSRIVVGYYDEPRIDIFSATDLKLVRSSPPSTSRSRLSRLMAVAWSQDGRFIYAGGDYREKQRNVIIRWASETLDEPQYFPVFTTFTVSILPLGDGKIAYASTSGDFGLMDGNGNEIYVKYLQIADQLRNKAFLVSHDGLTIQFGYKKFGGSPALFSVESKQLELKPSGKLQLSAPLQSAPGIQISDWDQHYDPKLNGQPLKLRDRFEAICYAIAPGGETFILGTWWYLYLFDKAGNEKWHVPIPGTARCANISGDGRYAVVALNDGTIRWYRMNDGKEILSFFPSVDRKRWVLWTPSGYYDAGEGGDELVGWHVNNGYDREASFYPVSRFFERFYRPDVVARVLRTAETDDVALARLGEQPALSLQTGMRQPPSVAILSPLPGMQLDGDDLEVKIAVEDGGGGIDEVRLYLNGKILPGGAGAKVSREGGSQQHVFAIKLIEGANQLKATAFSKDRIESNPMEITVVLKGAERESDLHLVVIGINRYKNAALNLAYAEPDALGIKTFFQSADVKRLFRNVRITSLMNEEATGPNIKNLFKEVEKKAEIRDTLLIYLAGHGDTAGDDWYFVPHDVVSPEIEEDLKRGGISDKEISETLKRCKAQKVFVMIDSCKSGKMILAMRGTEYRKALVQLARSTGTYIVSASTDKQYAAEIQSLGHGVFTYTLLEGLQGKGGDQKVTVEGLIHYVKNRLPELTEKHRGAAQYPVSWGSGMDFPIAIH